MGILRAFSFPTASTRKRAKKKAFDGSFRSFRRLNKMFTHTQKDHIFSILRRAKTIEHARQSHRAKRLASLKKSFVQLLQSNFARMLLSPRRCSGVQKKSRLLTAVLALPGLKKKKERIRTRRSYQQDA